MGFVGDGLVLLALAALVIGWRAHKLEARLPPSNLLGDDGHQGSQAAIVVGWLKIFARLIFKRHGVEVGNDVLPARVRQ